MKLNLGCGNDLRQDCINVDCRVPRKPYLEVKHKFEIPPHHERGETPIFIHLDLEQNSWNRLPKADVIIAHDLVEHLKNLHQFMLNAHQQLESGGLLDILVPDYRHEDAYKSMHERVFSVRSFDRFREYKDFQSNSLENRLDLFRAEQVTVNHEHPFCWHQRKYLGRELVGFKPHNIRFKFRKI